MKKSLEIIGKFFEDILLKIQLTLVFVAFVAACSVWLFFFTLLAIHYIIAYTIGFWIYVSIVAQDIYRQFYQFYLRIKPEPPDIVN